MKTSFICGDVLAVLKTLPSDYFDAVLSDPPYGISFMGKEWDKGVPSAEVYAELNRVLKPGAFGLHFGGTRMWHRLAVNLEDAGFELRDTVMWLYGSGFPKSHNISKALDKASGAEREVVSARSVAIDRWTAEGRRRLEAGESGSYEVLETAPATSAAKLWDGYGTALKPAWEPALLVQKPLAGTFANNALVHGCGALNIEGTRVGTEPVAKLVSAPAEARGGRTIYGEGVLTTIKGCELGTSTGRFPANLLLDEESAAALDAMTGDKQGPSRFFYTAKVSTRERNAGCGALAAYKTTYAEGTGLRLNGDGTPRPTAYSAKNNHPTLKPLALTEYLAKLLLVPPRADGQPRRLLVPFSGAGSEAIGAALAGWDEVVGIEIDPEYIKIAEARAAHHLKA